MISCITQYPKSKVLQLAFRYGDPVLVAAETLTQLKHEGKIEQADEEHLMKSYWWLAMLTTRVLLAHSIYIEDKHAIIDPLIANIRNLLRTLDVDIGDKDACECCRDVNDLRYHPLQSNGKFWMCLKNNREDILRNLETVSFDIMNEQRIELCSNHPGVKHVFDIFGRAVHELVGTRDSGWKVKTRKYQCVSDV